MDAIKTSKKRKFQISATTFINVQNTMLSEISQAAGWCFCEVVRVRHAEGVKNDTWAWEMVGKAMVMSAEFGFAEWKRLLWMSGVTKGDGADKIIWMYWMLLN